MIVRVMMAAMVLSGVGFALAEGPDEADVAQFDLKQFQLVFLTEEWVETPTPQNQLDRMVYAQDFFRQSMIDSGGALIAGPVYEQEALREVAIVALDSPEQAAAAYGRSPAVNVGQRKVRAYTLWAQDGILQKPPNHKRRIDCYLGLLKRRYPIKHFSDEELEEIQRGHLANIKKMADSGDLVLAGPVEDPDAETLRGILIFRTLDPEKIKRLVAEDPAIQKGRLVLELIRWNIADGTFPAPPEPSS